MGIEKVLVTQEYTHTYCMRKSIDASDCMWVRLKSNFQEAYLEREELKHTSGVSGYGSANNVKNGDMEDTFMNFVSATASRDT